MSKLPRTEEPPHPEEGYDAARVEEAFASFTDRVRELESVAGELRAELRSLRAERAVPRAPLTRWDGEEWPLEPGPSVAGFGPSPDWVSAVPAPIVRPLTIPRIALEGVFLLLVALFAGLADLSATWIVIVMAAAWALVAVSEWAAAAKRARWRLEAVAPAGEVPGEGANESTGPWNIPVIEATAIELPDVSESHTVIEPLPVDEAGVDAPGVDREPDAASAEARPKRLAFLRRRRAPESAADPWEV